MADLTVELRKQTEEAIQIIKDSGVTVTPAPTGSDLEEFLGIHDRVARELTGKVYPKDLLERVCGLLKRSEGSNQ